MVEKQFFSNQYVIDFLNNHYGIKVATLILLPLGADVNASLYQATTHEQSSYFIKIKHGHHHDMSATIIPLLHDAGISQVISPIKTNRGQFSQSVDDVTFTVFPFIEGRDGFHRDLTSDQWITLGKVMRQIHGIEVPTSIQHRIRREIYSSQWREVVRSLYVHIESKSSGDEIALKLIDFMKKHRVVIYRLVGRAEQLSQQIQSQQSEFVLCHSDIHGGNVLIDKNDSIYVVDWDDPIMAPKERDLMFVGGGVANVWNKPHEEVLFYKGYGNTFIDKAVLAYYRCERIVEDIAVVGQQLLLTSAGGQNRMKLYQQFVDQFEPNGVVEIAFKTDEKISK